MAVDPSTHSGALTDGPDDSSSKRLEKLYRHAADSFLTRQYDVAYTILEPVVSLPAPKSKVHPAPEVARMAEASKSLRIKIWCLYLTLLQAIIIRDMEDRDHIGGHREFRSFYAKIQDGHIWDEVVSVGYDGVEERVDIEVVISLATLCLKNPHNHEKLRFRLERYLSALTRKISARADSVKVVQSDTANENSTDSSLKAMFKPEEVTSIHILIELYALHVLPQDKNWDRARDYLTTNLLLDDDTRGTFLKTLDSLEAKMTEAETAESEVSRKTKDAFSEMKHQSSASHEGSAESETLPAVELGGFPDSTESYERVRRRKMEASLLNQDPSFWRFLREDRRPSQVPGVMGTFSKYVLFCVTIVKSNWAGLLKTILFVIGIVFATSKQTFRRGMRRIMTSGWGKVKATVGMGMKVSSYA